MNMTWLRSGLGLRFKLLAAGCALAMIAGGCMMEPSAEDSFNVKIGDEVPAFSLKDTAGNVVSSESMLGKPYVIAVFATWCPPCKMELAALETDVWRPLKDKGVGVVGIDFGDEDAQLISKFAAENDLTFPLLVDMDASFRTKAGAMMVPQSLVIGPDGKILDLHVGFTDESVEATKTALIDALK